MGCAITNQGAIFRISNEVANSDLDAVEFAKLSYVDVPNLGSHGETGIEQDIVSFPSLGMAVRCKRKGMATARDYSVEFLDKDSPGMDVMLSASDPLNRNSYAFMIEWPDGAVEFNRGVLTGPGLPKGANEDFKVASFTIAPSQEPVKTNTIDMYKTLSLAFWDPTVTLDPRITFTRNSNASRWNHYGVLEVVPPGVARAHAYADHDPETYATSDTRISIGYGSRTLAVDYQYQLGAVVRATYDDNNYVIGRVTASDGVATTLSVLRAVGSGSYDSWHVIEVLGFRTETRRTNLILRSGDFAASIWNKNNVAVIPSGVTAPDGETEAGKLRDSVNVTSAAHYIGQPVSFTAGKSYVYSVFAKAAELSCLQLIYINSSFGVNVTAVFNLLTGEHMIGPGGENTGTFIQRLPNGWFRCAIVAQATASNMMSPQIRGAESYSVVPSSRIGDGESGIYIWGGALEEALSPSSYIATESSSATRLPDVMRVADSDFSSFYRKSEGTFVVTAMVDYPLPADTFIGAVDARTVTSTQNMVRLSTNAFMHHRASVRKDNVSGMDLNAGGTLVPGQMSRWGIAYAENNSAASANGGTAVVDTSVAIPTDVDALLIGSETYGKWDGCILDLLYIRTRVSNDQLPLLTKVPGTP